MTALAKQDKREVARPLKILEPLIISDIEAGEEAGQAYFISAGEKLNEARDGHFQNDATGFWKWAERKFGKNRYLLRDYMGRAAVHNPKSFKSQNEYKRSIGRRTDPIGPGSRISREWTAPVDMIAERARAEQRRLYEQEELTRKQEREAEEKLGLRLIDIGYRVLAKELHPDKGGSREAMARLGRVRDRLKANV